jgi:hypothetical protein
MQFEYVVQESLAILTTVYGSEIDKVGILGEPLVCYHYHIVAM